MSEVTQKNEFDSDSERVFSKAVKAGRRVYFFDVKLKNDDEYFLTITESRKKPTKDGKFTFEKHKLFIFKEDFNKFSEGLTDSLSFIKTKAPALFDESQIEHLIHNSPILDISHTLSEDEFDNL